MSSPAEFLTFYRALRPVSALRNTSRQCLARSSRPFTTTFQRRGDIGPEREHVLDKAPKGDDKTNIQSQQSKGGRDARAQGGADAATAQKDTLKQKDKIKKENPEAPDTIGFQDHRGGSQA